MTRPLEERRSHLKLEESCIEIGGKSSGEYRGLLAHFTHTTIPMNREAVLCHACENYKCSNPCHLYWGTQSENILEGRRSGRVKTPWEQMVQKYGEDEARKRASQFGALRRKKRLRSSVARAEDSKSL